VRFRRPREHDETGPGAPSRAWFCNPVRMAHRENDFSKKVIETAYLRTGGRCSAPSCRCATTGPSATKVSGVTSIGVAAHIVAASPGGPRDDPAVSDVARRSQENAIWLCQNHAKEIDDDEERYTRALLRDWRAEAQSAATRDLGEAREQKDVETAPLVPLRRVVTRSHLRNGIDEFLSDVGAPTAWGRETCHSAWMALYEIALNATNHGGARFVTLESEPGLLSLSDEGSSFGPAELAAVTNPGGGTAALLAFREECNYRMTLGYRQTTAGNLWFIADRPTANPCALYLNVPSRSQIRRVVEERLEILRSCDEIHVYLPRLWSFSDAEELVRVVQNQLDDVSRVHLRGSSTMSKPLVAHVRAALPQVIIDEG
jgi:hypothetical protein